MSRRFSTVLVANRGEIACRVIRTARAEGYRTVAVYSDADRYALHVRMADEAVRIGPPPVGESYLNVARILDAAKRTGADAVHPGYGFLSENAAFAKACAEAGLVFVGPPPKAIELMGNKAAAKRLMLKAGVPCVLGYEGEAQDEETLVTQAKQIGFPVLLKAAAGGGGRGMRRVTRLDDFAEALAGARYESKSAFGSDELIIEQLVENARHVEIQVLGDEHGACIHLGERDCSVQRRHQKIIEESPCPVMTPELRAAMGTAAVKAASAVGYTNAGTVEFLLDADGKFYFLEMNTRLQVEHPVTEMVTGLDLVSLQLKVAQGDALPLTQGDVAFKGHAIEARLYAEDPHRDFAPQIGKVLEWEPGVGAGIRVDHGLYSGGEITPYYDAMVAKVIAWGASREEACGRLSAALRNTVLFGVGSNRALLRGIVEHTEFASGKATTAFLDQSGLLAPRATEPSVNELLIAAAAFIERDSRNVPASLKGWRSTGSVTVPIKLRANDTVYPLHVTMTGSNYAITTQEETAELTVESSNGNTMRFRTDDREASARYAFDGGTLYLDYAGNAVVYEDITYAPPAGDAAVSDGVLKAPMAGEIVRVNVAPGANVKKSEVLVVLGAMKIENQIVAPFDGVVDTVGVSAGEQVEANRVLLTLTADAT